MHAAPSRVGGRSPAMVGAPLSSRAPPAGLRAALRPSRAARRPVFARAGGKVRLDSPAPASEPPVAGRPRPPERARPPRERMRSPGAREGRRGRQRGRKQGTGREERATHQRAGWEEGKRSRSGSKDGSAGGCWWWRMPWVMLVGDAGGLACDGRLETMSSASRQGRLPCVAGGPRVSAGGASKGLLGTSAALVHSFPFTPLPSPFSFFLFPV